MGFTDQELAERREMLKKRQQHMYGNTKDFSHAVAWQVIDILDELTRKEGLPRVFESFTAQGTFVAGVNGHWRLTGLFENTGCVVPNVEDYQTHWVVVNNSKLYFYADDDFKQQFKPVIAVQTEPNDAVNHPNHYGGKDNPYEVIKVIRAWGLDWLLGSAVKYIPRAGKKDPDTEIQDLEKSVFYLNEKIKELKEARKNGPTDPMA